MESIFMLCNGDRARYLNNLMSSFGYTYICLWTYSPDLNLLYCEEGHFQEVASSSSVTSLAQNLFQEYKKSLFIVGDQSFVPGLAFKNRKPYIELQEQDLQRLASAEVQRQFYVQARIKISVFLGCDRGEIELGMPFIPQNLEMRMQNIFTQDFATLKTSQAIEVPRMLEQSRTTSPSSSSFQSIDSPEYSHLFNTLPTTVPYLSDTPPIAIQPTIEPQTNTISTTLSQLLESADTALMRAYLTILSPSTNIAQQCDVSSNCGTQVNQRQSAFKSYHQSSSTQIRPNLMGRQTLFKRVIAYYREMNNKRIQEYSSAHGSRPSSTQLHHMISERRRREKINDSFQALRSLLPHGTKKDKASVLRTTKEYLTSLKTQLSELSKRNQVLEAQLKMKKETSTTTTIVEQDFPTNERLSIQINPVHESTSSSSSRERMVELQVRVRGNTSMDMLIMRLLGYINQSREVRLVSMEAQSVGQSHISTDIVAFRLRIEGDEWHETNFKEAITRILGDYLGPGPTPI